MTPETMEIGLPEKMEISQDGLGLLITRRWFGWQTGVLTAFAIFWDGSIFFWASVVWKHASATMLWFPVLHVTAGIYVTYLALAGWLNSTRVRINFGKITVISGPLPFFSNKAVDSSAIKQIYSKERISRNEDGYTSSYAVHAILSDQRNIKLADGLDSSEQALFVEQQIEKYLGIKDVPVKGELNGGACDRGRSYSR